MTLQSDLEAAFFDRPQSIIQGPFSSTTTVLIVHGGWHIPYHYQPLVSSFADAGYLTICPFLPTCNDAKPPNKTLDEDIGVVRAVLAVLAHTGKDIVVVMHSFGGLIGSVAIDGKDLKKQQRMQTLGTATGGVVALIFMSAFVALDDLSLAEALPGGLPDWIQPEANGTLSLVRPDNFFYHDLAPAVQQEMMSKLVCHPISAQTTKLPPVDYEGLTLGYIVCEDDRALIPAWQRNFIELLKAKPAVEKVIVGSCRSSHSPFRKCPQEVVNFTKEVLRSVAYIV